MEAMSTSTHTEPPVDRFALQHAEAWVIRCREEASDSLLSTPQGPRIFYRLVDAERTAQRMRAQGAAVVVRRLLRMEAVVERRRDD